MAPIRAVSFGSEDEGVPFPSLIGSRYRPSCPPQTLSTGLETGNSPTAEDTPVFQFTGERERPRNVQR